VHSQVLLAVPLVPDGVYKILNSQFSEYASLVDGKICARKDNNQDKVRVVLYTA